MTLNSEAQVIVDTLADSLPATWDGRESIGHLKAVDHMWRQMEWIGWWFEYFGKQAIQKKLGGRDGPEFGQTRFDYQMRWVWDLKAHAGNGANGRTSHKVITNDYGACVACINGHAGVGFIVAEGRAAYDSDGSFKRWHDELKGGRSAYERARVARGAASRRRKVSFTVARYSAIFLSGMSVVQQGKRDGWILQYKQGRNSDGSPRAPKLMLDLAKAPDSVVAARRIT